jgi:hypothetical protein
MADAMISDTVVFSHIAAIAVSFSPVVVDWRLGMAKKTKSKSEPERSGSSDRTPEEKFAAFQKLLKAVVQVPKREVKSAR